jgi:hypothetical protein
MTVYEQVYAKSSPLITAYRDDLEKIDRQYIDANPGMPFIHYTREWGTHLYFLVKSSELPAAGVEVPYLFGHADRQHMVDELVSCTRYHADPRNGTMLLVLHFDGAKIHETSISGATGIAETWRNGIMRQWKRESDIAQRGASHPYELHNRYEIGYSWNRYEAKAA